ncbi:MAG: diguanylate cyclase [Bacteroides sp.]|nr:diguanylate cyclase [Bacteroides sp.]
MKIRTLFIFALVFFSISSIIAYAIYCSSSMNNIAEKQYERLYSDIAVNESKNITEYVKSLSAAASVVASDENISGYSLSDSGARSAAAEAAEEYITSETGIVRVVVLNKSGEVSFSAAKGEDVNYKLFDKDMLDRMVQGEAYISTVLDSSDRESSYELVAPYMLSDRTVMVYFSSSYLDGIIKAGSFPTNGHIVLVDGLNHIVDTAYVGTLDEISSRTGYIQYNTVGSAVKDSSLLNSSRYFEMGKNSQVAYTVKATGCGWYAAAMAEVDKAYGYSSVASSNVVGLVIGLSALFAAVYIVAIVIITKPLANIEATLVKINRGDHDSRIEVANKNEYGEIASSFNYLIDNLVVSERRYRTIVEMSNDIVFEWNMKTNNVTFSNNFNKKFSYRPPSDHFTDSFFIKGRVHPEDNERYRKDLTKLEKGEEFKDNTYRWKNIYGDYIWMAMKTSTIRDGDGNIIKIIGVLSDVDRAKKGELQLIERASYDALTGVYNRETIENVINEEIQKVAEGSDGFAILFVDIDDFKIYNDQYSHATGDQVLKFVTDSIGEITEDFGFTGRYGGDEFIVCIRNCSTNIPENVARDILAKLKAGFDCDMEEHLSVSVSIGVYIVSNADKTVEEIISIADDAMYKIKKSGKSSFGIVSDQQS